MVLAEVGHMRPASAHTHTAGVLVAPGPTAISTPRAGWRLAVLDRFPRCVPEPAPQATQLVLAREGQAMRPLVVEQHRRGPRSDRQPVRHSGPAFHVKHAGSVPREAPMVNGHSKVILDLRGLEGQDGTRDRSG